jgi:hypothetical protein
VFFFEEQEVRRRKRMVNDKTIDFFNI